MSKARRIWVWSDSTSAEPIDMHEFITLIPSMKGTCLFLYIAFIQVMRDPSREGIMTLGAAATTTGNT